MPKPSFQKLLNQARNHLPHHSFKSGVQFAWLPESKTITYNPHLPEASALLLHEIGHAELGHGNYAFDIELIRYESAAWERAKKLAIGFLVPIHDDFIEDNLDTYREWLHARSKCPQCQQVGIQAKKNTYSCINCRYSWRVNDAKQCLLRRLKLQDQN